MEPIMTIDPYKLDAFKIRSYEFDIICGTVIMAEITKYETRKLFIFTMFVITNKKQRNKKTK
jgi:hypothetical protein